MRDSGKLLEQTPRCKKCKYFRPHDYDETRGICSKTETVAGDPYHEDSLAVARDAESYRAYLEVHEDFGCVMFEPVEEE